MDLALATCRPLPVPDPDQAPLERALTEAGISFEWMAWDDHANPSDSARFADARFVLIRSTWDYIHHYESFLAWAQARGSSLLNPAAAVRWNAHKGYLHRLAGEGLPVVPTELLVRGSEGTLREVLLRRGWADAVVKPAVSAGSFSTRRVRVAARNAVDEAFFAELVAARDTLVQPYVRSVEEPGERSLIVIDGEVTHSIRKTARFAGEHAKVNTEAQPVQDDEREFALQAMAIGEKLTGEPLFYGRVDMARHSRGGLLLMELELIEPSLYFAQSPPALARFVAGLQRRLGQRGAA